MLAHGCNIQAGVEIGQDSTATIEMVWYFASGTPIKDFKSSSTFPVLPPRVPSAAALVPAGSHTAPAPACLYKIGVVTVGRKVRLAVCSLEAASAPVGSGLRLRHVRMSVGEEAGASGFASCYIFRLPRALLPHEAMNSVDPELTSGEQGCPMAFITPKDLARCLSGRRVAPADGRCWRLLVKAVLTFGAVS